MSGFWDRLWEFLYPPRANCQGCGDVMGADEGFLCEECNRLLVQAHDLRGERCPLCGRPGRWDRSCKTCRDWPPGLIALCRFAYPYQRPVDRLIQRMKYQGVWTLTVWMAGEIARAMATEAFPSADVVVCVPMHAARLRQRGFNHAERIARQLAVQLDLPFEDAISRVRNTRQQARLRAAKRRENLIGAFVADARVAGKRVLLVDDVLTTGATALGCAKACKQAGAREIYVVTLAAPV